MTKADNTGWIGRAAITAVLLCAPAAWAYHSGTPAPHSAPAPAAHASAPAAHSPRPQNQGRSGPQFQSRPQGNAARRPASGYSATRPTGSAPAYPGPPYLGPGFSRPAVRGYAPPAQLPPGHLGDWLNQHRNLPVQEQERMLRNDPSFHRLPPGEQQRVVRQLHRSASWPRSSASAVWPAPQSSIVSRPRNRCASTSPRAAGPSCRRSVRQS